jgi:hypothetical protein
MRTLYTARLANDERNELLFHPHGASVSGRNDGQVAAGFLFIHASSSADTSQEYLSFNQSVCSLFN